jgi:hypothetical protein
MKVGEIGAIFFMHQTDEGRKLPNFTAKPDRKRPNGQSRQW